LLLTAPVFPSLPGCATNYYKDASGTCKPCKGAATSAGGEAATCQCTDASLQGDYSLLLGCGE
jgi:hypothetical protein